MSISGREIRADKNFRWFWLGQSVSVLGSQFSGLAFAVVAVSILHANEIEMGFLNASTNVGFLLVGLFAGAWIDRWRKRKVMLVADIVRFAALLVVPFLFFMGALEIWNVIVISFVIGIATVFFDVSYQSYIPILVPKQGIGSANSMLETSSQVSRLGGPTLAGLLLSVVSAPIVFLVDAVAFAFSTFTLTRIKDSETPIPRNQRQSLRKEIAEGVKFVWHQKIIRSIAFTTATSNIFSTAIFTLIPLLLLRDMAMSPAQLGVLETIGAIGGLLGALSTTRLIKKFGEGSTIVVSAVLSGAVMLVIPLAAESEPIVSFLLLALNFFAFGFTVLVYNITQVSARQRLCPEHLLGRMNASIRFFVWGVMPISAIFSGLLAHSIGIVPALLLCAIGGVAASIFVIVSPLPKLKEIVAE